MDGVVVGEGGEGGGWDGEDVGDEGVVWEVWDVDGGSWRVVGRVWVRVAGELSRRTKDATIQVTIDVAARAATILNWDLILISPGAVTYVGGGEGVWVWVWVWGFRGQSRRGVK